MALWIFTLFSLLGILPRIFAWGNLGHTTVAYIAQNFVGDEAAKFVQNIFGDASSTYMAAVATWADEYRATSAGKFSAPFHFLDALDNPSNSCSVDYERDCTKRGCIVSAIANYSGRAIDNSIGRDEQQKALKWLIHFLGDIHQPLHVESLALGGNQIHVTFGSQRTNLHASWDTSIPQKRAGTFSQANALAWAQTLTSQIKTGQYKDEAKSWLQNISVTNAATTSLLWAAESNRYVCSTVMPNGEESVSGRDLSHGYYDAAIPVVEKQLARAGYRLAAWLDAIVASTDQTREGFGTGKLAIRGDFKYEPWMSAAQEAREVSENDCGCGADHHHHH